MSSCGDGRQLRSQPSLAVDRQNSVSAISVILKDDGTDDGTVSARSGPSCSLSCIVCVSRRVGYFAVNRYNILSVA